VHVVDVLWLAVAGCVVTVHVVFDSELWVESVVEVPLWQFEFWVVDVSTVDVPALEPAVCAAAQWASELADNSARSSRVSKSNRLALKRRLLRAADCLLLSRFVPNVTIVCHRFVFTAKIPLVTVVLNLRADGGG